MTIETLGIDIAKNVLQLHGVNRGGWLRLTRRVKRHQLLRNLSTTLRQQRLGFTEQAVAS